MKMSRQEPFLAGIGSLVASLPHDLNVTNEDLVVDCMGLVNQLPMIVYRR